MWNQLRIATTVIATAVFAVAMSPIAYAQAESAPQAQPETGSKPDANVPAKPDANVPEEKLDKAAAAIGQVVALKETFSKRFEVAPEAERAKILDEAKLAMTKAVTDQGLSVEEYSKILQVAENDPSVRSKIIQRLRPEGAD